MGLVENFGAQVNIYCQTDDYMSFFSNIAIEIRVTL